jgi:cobalt/nickel transport system ATP-binding protein
VFQNPDDQLFMPTVGEDVAFGPANLGCDAEETARRVGSALRRMRLEGFEQRATAELSFGEKRRAALATVLAMEPEVIGFDEPFANNDPATVEQLIETINGLAATVILVSQEILPAVACADRIAVLHEGRLAAIGPAVEIVRDRSLLQRCNVDFHFYGQIWEQIAGRR